MKPLPAIPASDQTFWLWVARHLANFEIVSEVPTVNELKKGDMIIYESGTTRRLYVNIGGTIYFLGINNANKIIDLDGDTWVEVERTADGDIIWMRTAGTDRIKIDESGNTYIGDGGVTNYVKIAPDGNITLFGTARVEKEFRLDLAGTGGGANSPTFDNDFSPFDGFNYSINDDAHWVFEIPSEVDTSEPIAIHIHWFIDRAFASESGEVKFDITYRAVKEDGTEPVDSGGQTATITSGDTNIPAVAKALTETEVGQIVAANIEQDDVIGIDLSRVALIDGNNPGGAPAKNPIITNMEIHATVNKLGAAT